MCGIFGCVLTRGDAAPLIHEALKRLEYMRYDSAGLATIHGRELDVRKDVGSLREVHERHNLNGASGSVGIGHIRWATHGAPVYQVNAHPQLDCGESVAVVHNGVIENYEELKAELEGRGHKFRSKTDTEVIPHLIEDGLKDGLSLPEAVRKAVGALRGSYAIAAVWVGAPDMVVCAKMESPLLLGVAGDATYCASHLPALTPLTNRIIHLGDGELAILRASGVDVRRAEDMKPLDKDVSVVNYTLEEAKRSGYPHYTLMEIHNQPLYLRNTLRLQRKYLNLMSAFLDRAEEVFLVASGSSYNACIAASYMFSELAYLATHPVSTSEFVERYGDAVDIGSTILAISESGEDADVLAAVEHARFRAATILGLTNVIGSTLTCISRVYVCQQSGPPIGSISIRTFTAQTLVLAQAALQLAEMRGKLSHGEIEELEKGLKQIPELMGWVVRTQEGRIREIAERYHDRRAFFVLGRGISNATAQEGCLKLVELARVTAIAYPAGESKHGPISLIEPGFPVIFVCPRDETHETVKGNIQEMRARGAEIIAIIEEGDEEIAEMAHHIVEVPRGVHPVLSPIVYVVPLQLLAYYTAVERGVDPDRVHST